MNLFEKLLEIKTGKTYLMTKAIYIPHTNIWGEGMYYIYYYDLLNHTFYINDLKGPFTENRTSAINIIETIVSKAYKQELNACGKIVKKILSVKKPRVIYFYRQKNTNVIIIDRVNLQAVKNRKKEIVRFKNPTWDSNSSEKVNEDQLQVYSSVEKAKQ